MTDRTSQIESTAIQVTRREPGSAEQAFMDTAFERASLDKSEVLRLNLDLEAATIVALGTVNRIRPLLDSISELPIDAQLLQRLEQYVRATIHAQALYRAAHRPPDGLDATYRAAIEARRMLRLDAENLAFHKWVDGRVLKRLRFAMGHLNVGYDVLALVNLLRDALPTTAGRSALSEAELDSAERTAEALLTISAGKGDAKKRRLLADDERRRAFTLLYRAYDQVRRALAFVRWHDRDPARIAPALHTAKGGGRPKKRRAPRTLDPSLSPTRVGSEVGATGESAPRLEGGPSSPPDIKREH